MNWSAIDWRALERLRAAFLAGTAGQANYWQRESDLASYDATFAQRIGWKWDYVLAGLQRRSWSPATGALLDWGCGSGIAHRAWLDRFGTTAVSELRLWDRSPLAMRFAERRAQEKYPGLKVAAGSLPTPVRLDGPLPADNRPTGGGAHGVTRPATTSAATLLLSHVLTELQPAQIEALADFATSATSVIWVEPGTYEASRSLIAVRERLREKFNVIAPCTHQAGCGILAPGNKHHWCHHFAPPPPGVFTDGQWAKFGELAGVDLRSLPVSFLVLDRRSAPVMSSGAVRVIGRPRLYKPYAQLLACDASGVREKRISKRHLPEVFRQLKRGDSDPLQVWRSEGDEVMEARPLQ